MKYNFVMHPASLNRFETVWVWLRAELARMEMAKLDTGKTISVQQFRQRASQILQSFEAPRPGERASRLERLIAGMPKRLTRCKANRYGKCCK